MIANDLNGTDPLSTFARQLVAEWRARAVERKREGANTGDVYDLVASELEQKARDYLTTPLSIEEAVRVSGYSESRLRELVAEGKTTLSPADLPRRPIDRLRGGKRRVESGPLSSAGGTSLAHVVLARRGGR
jgi:hypothetical protein